MFEVPEKGSCADTLCLDSGGGGDQAGNLVKTVPPQGVDVSKFAWAASWSDTVKAARRNRQVLRPNHGLKTEYRYNTLNQVVQQVSPDGGLTRHWYDRLGRLAVSQNAKQRAAGSSNDQDKQYSYTSYDHLSRITEVGQMKNTSANGAMSDALSRNPDQLNNWLLNLTNRREQVTQTIYDQPFPGFVGSPVPATVIAQRNLRNRVSYVSYTDNHLTSAFNQATFYTYDVLGNVDTLLQDYGCGTCGTQATYNMMNRNANGRKKITYQYDLVSGKVNMMLYQNGWNDMWLHRYTYDAENRLTLVETSNDSIVWEKEARYEYYRHGPLARTVLGDQLVQGIDYAYTLQGWLKGMNSTGATATHDMGGDGRTGSLNQYTARDALGFNLNYFGGDYTSINSTVTPFPKYYGLTSGGLPDSLYRPLYNGNISSMATNIRMFQSQYGGQSLFYNYKYDQLNRITRQDVYKNFDRVNNHYNALDIRDSLFRERIAYDANGNILKYHRYNSGGDSEMDSLSYKYYAGTNRLRRVRDSVRSGKFGSNGWEVIVDIDDQPDSNYAYDEIGNIIRDSAEKITSIKWNVYGKITEITRSALATDKNKTIRVRYTYDAAGNRISKVEEKAGTNSKDYTWYAQDAQGNIIAIYKASGSVDVSTLQNLTVNVSEHMIYGSSRLGMAGYYGSGVDINNQGPISRETYSRGTFSRGYRQYELSNHLGNVLTTISDKKFGVSSGAIGSLIDYYEPDIVSANDYYPFGMVSRVGQTTTGVAYRFGFNGKENDNEVKDKFNQQDYGMRIYDPRVGRFLSVDPLTRQYPQLTPYQFAGNTPIQAIDLDGNEPKYMIDANGKLTKPVVALLMSAFAGIGSDWSEKRLTNSTWVKDESLKNGTKRAYVNTIKNGQSIHFNPDFEEVTMKKFSEGSKFEPWLNLIAHEEYHIMQQDWGIISLIVAEVQGLFAEREKKMMEAPAYSYGEPFKLNTEVANLLRMPEGYKIHYILTDEKMTDEQKVKEVSLIGLNYNKIKTLQDKASRAKFLNERNHSVDNDDMIKLYDKRLKQIDEKINTLSSSKEEGGK